MSLIEYFIRAAERARPAQGLLRRKAIRPADFLPCLANIMLLDAIDGGADFHYRLVGEAIRTALGTRIQGVRVSDRRNPLVNRDGLLLVYRQALASPAPIRVSGVYHSTQGTERPFVAAGLAISEDGLRPSGIMACTEFTRGERITGFPAIEDEAEGLLAGPFGPDFGTVSLIPAAPAGDGKDKDPAKPDPDQAGRPAPGLADDGAAGSGAERTA